MPQQTSDSTAAPSIDPLNAAIARALSPLRVPQPLTLSEWADKHFYLSAESSGIAGKWQTLPYQRAIMNCIGNDG